MADILFRCSSIGRLMTEPKSKSSGPLSEGAKTYIRELVAQEIFGVDFEFSSKQTEKGIEVEQQSIDMLNRVRGLHLTKNTERRDNGFISGECDLFDPSRRRGHDIKSPWSVATFPIVPEACEDKLYEWQMRGYMALWDADEWEVNYCLVDTPDRLIGYEPLQLHIVGHIPENMRITTWTVTRDLEKEAAIMTKIEHARAYFRQVVAEFDATHQADIPAWHAEAPVEPWRPPLVATPAAPAPIPAQPEALPELF